MLTPPRIGTYRRAAWETLRTAGPCYGRELAYLLRWPIWRADNALAGLVSTGWVDHRSKDGRYVAIRLDAMERHLERERRLIDLRRQIRGGK